MSKRFFITLLPLLLTVVLFLGFGLYHLTKFETIDERLWKYDRIEKLQNGIKEGLTKGNWKKTRVNDKPGTTVALVSGIGMQLGPNHPNMHENIEAERASGITLEDGTIKPLFTIFRTHLTESINFSLRFPLLLFNAVIMLPLLFWLTWRVFGKVIASFFILFLGLSPILIGISQIINPDTFLWSFGMASLLSFIALLRTQEKKFVILCGVLTGLSLLSKYTANLLFLFYPMLAVLYFFFQTKSIRSKTVVPIIQVFSRRFIRPFVYITLLAWGLFIVGMPAVFHKPQHFLYGTVYSPTLAPITNTLIDITNTQSRFFLEGNTYSTVSIGILSVVIFFMLTLLLPIIALLLTQAYPRAARALLNVAPSLLALIFLISFLNAWTHTAIFSLDDIKEVSLENGSTVFPQVGHYPPPLRAFLAIAIQAQNFVFSLHPLAILCSVAAFFALFLRRLTRYAYILYFLAIVPFIFFLGGSFAGVFVNVRYGILLYAFYALSAAIGATWLARVLFKRFSKDLVLSALISVIALGHIISLLEIKPHYFVYESFLLPKEYVVTDSWGYGFYEAAQWLNTLPNAENLTVRVDRRGLCQFFVGKCYNESDIDPAYMNIDYLVFTRRGSIRSRFTVEGDAPNNQYDPAYYYSDIVFNNPDWKIGVGGREKDFVKIIKIQ